MHIIRGLIIFLKVLLPGKPISFEQTQTIGTNNQYINIQNTNNYLSESINNINKRESKINKGNIDTQSDIKNRKADK